jgi:hypothetical protein
LTKRVIFNFFDGDKTMLALCKHFNLDKFIIERYIAQEMVENGENLNTSLMTFDFIKNFNLPVDKIDTANVFITAKHITTLSDKGASLKKYGLLNLKDMLEKDTPLSQFLKKKGIKFDVDGKKIIISEMELNLFRCNNDCKPCSFNRKRCIQFSPEYKKAINLIYIKLYSDKAETEVFLCGKDDEIENYTFIKRYPEFLNNLDNLLTAMQKPLCLSRQWSELQNAQYYILEFDVSIEALELIPDCIYDEKPTYEVFEKYFDFLGYSENHFVSNLIPNRFYSNVFLVKNSLDVFFGTGKRYGQIIPETIIPYNDLRILRKSIS